MEHIFQQYVQKFLLKYSLDSNLHLILVCIIGGIFASIFGFIIGCTTLRLKEDYLAIITLAFWRNVKIYYSKYTFPWRSCKLNGIPIILSFSSTFFIVVVSSTILIMILISQKRKTIFICKRK